MRIAIIPARRGSARAPGKNTAIVDGLSLVERAVRQTLRVSLYDEIIVSSDDEAVLESVKEYPVIVNERKPSLGGDKAPIVAVIADLINAYEIPPDAIASLLVVTAPLREDADIVEAHKVFEDSNQLRSLVSVCEVDYPVEMTWRKKEDGSLYSPFEISTTRKQDFQPSYRWNDAIIIDVASSFLVEGRNLFGDNPIPFEMPPERSICIDYNWQLELIRKIIEKNGDNQ